MADEPADLHQSLTDLLAADGIDQDRLRELTAFFHPVDLAEFLEDLSLDDRTRIFGLLDPERAARVLEALPHDPRVALVDRVGEDKLSPVIDRMSADAVADIIDHLPAHKEKAVLNKVGAEHRRRIETLRRFASNTAGGLMTKNYVSVRDGLTAGATLKTIQGAIDAETTEYVYVTDETDRLAGVCSIRAVLRARPETLISSVMTQDVQFVGAGMDQEEVAKIVQKYGFKAIPVVDNMMKLIGVVTQARILDVVHQEAGEDLMKVVGAGDLDPLHAPISRRVGLRLPWLLPALAIELALAWVLRGYDSLLRELTTLAFFIPVIMAMGGNVGLQASTTVVRGLATGTIGAGRVFRVFLAEFKAGLVIGLICGALTGPMCYIMHVGRERALQMGVIVFVSMVTSITLASGMGTLLPFTLHRMKRDPAVASGPFITAFNDMLNVTLYLTLATLLMWKSRG